MAFKPANANNTSSSNQTFEKVNYPTPKAGSRKARVSLIVDLGVQERDDIYELDGKAVPEGTEGAICKPQKPCQQLAVFADLVADKVDYGGSIGEQHYRLLLNNSFAGKLKGINFTATPPKDAKGNTIAGGKWGFHPANVLTKLAKAVGKPEVIESMDVEELLDMPFMATVEVKTKDSGKKDESGEPIIYKNVNFKGATEVPLDDDDQPLPVAKLAQKAQCITFDNAKPEDIKFIRGNIIKQIKLASNYAGSQMEKAIQAFEAERNNAKEEAQEEEKPVTKTASKSKAKPAPNFSDMDDDIPFMRGCKLGLQDTFLGKYAHYL
jgi:hypothetical protein